MCISEKFCEQNLKLLFTALKRCPAPTVRCNIVVALGDLYSRFPNRYDDDDDDDVPSFLLLAVVAGVRPLTVLCSLLFLVCFFFHGTFGGGVQPDSLEHAFV